MKINLPQPLSHADLYVEQPCIIFEIDEFIDPSQYQQLIQDVVKLKDFELHSKKGGKKSTSYGRHNVHKLSDSTFKDFCLEIFSHNFFDWFKSTHLPYFESDVKAIEASNRYSKLTRLFAKFCKSVGLPYRYYFAEVELSSIEKGRYIPPHTDVSTKRLSLVFYLPESQLPEEMENSLGTVFYKAIEGQEPWKRFHCGLLNKEEAVQFEEVHEPAFVASFKPNKCIGFIKTDVSWHAVKQNQFDYARRAIVINIFEM